MNDLTHRLERKLEDTKNLSRLRKLSIPSSGSIDFTSNDYLGLGRSEDLWNLIAQAYASLPMKRSGSGGSRLLSGHNRLYADVEDELASLFRADSCLLFTSGYAANTGVLSCLPSRNDTILYDEYAHASIKEGARLSLAKRHSFRHNDLADLKRKIEKSKGTVFIVAESVYSMDGDFCPLRELTVLAEQFKCVLVLDEAHSTGVYGPDGAGLAVESGLADKVDIRIMTFGKGMGVHGACVATNTVVKEFLINFSLPFIYTTAPSPHEVLAIQCAFRWLKGNIHLQQTLRKKIGLFREVCICETESRSAIQPILISGNDIVRKTSRDLQEKGFDVRPVVSPTVRAGSERLRICLHAFNSDDEIVRLANEVNRL